MLLQSNTKALLTPYNLLSNRFDKWLYCVCCQTGLTTGCIVYTITKQLSNRLQNRFDNQLYRVNGV